MALDTSVQSVKDFSSLLKLLRDDLRWPLPDEPSPEDITFDWSPGELRIQDAQAQRLKSGVVQQLRPLVSNQPLGIFYIEFADAQVYRTALRQVVRGLVPNRRRDPALQAWRHENLLFICATKDYQLISFAHFKGDALAKAKLATFGWERGSDYIHTLCKFNLPALSWPDDEADAESWLASWSKAFDKEPLTKEFFKRFDNALNLIKADLEKFQKLKSAEAYSRAQLLLERLLFLYFLQRRGWLNQNRDFLAENFKVHRVRPNEFSYYEDFLEKLFWSLASSPQSDNRLPGIPFLNGGLFDDDEFALTQVRKKHNPPLQIRNATFRNVFDNFLEVFHFTVREDTPLNQEVAVDPEMLGKVFESIVLHAEAADPEANAPDKRKSTGSYYTPRIVVHFICQEVLHQYLTNHLPGDNWAPRMKKILEIEATEGLEEDELKKLRELLTPKEGRTLLNMLKGLKCCDPAVGSGAFPVGLMHELVNLRRVAETAANGYVDPVRKVGHTWIHDTKEDIVEHCLYGVDIQQQAIEICRLRLWLTLIVDYDLGLEPFTADRGQFQEAIRKISQLPNLEMNFRRGDSLLDHISGVPVVVTLNRLTEYQKLFAKIEKLGAELHRARKSERKKSLRVDILRQRLDLSQRVLQDELKDLDRQKADITPGLFAQLGFDENTTESQKRNRIEHEIHQAEQALEKIHADRTALEKLAGRPFDTEFFPKLRKLEGADFDSPFNFAWRIDFPNIISTNSITTLAGEFGIVNEVQKQQELPANTGNILQSGFDIVVGNPPFVTARNPRKRKLYRDRWPRVCEGNYLLLSPFFELSFGLLKARGQLGFIVSNAFARRDLGKPLVEDFFPTVNIQKVVDCSGLQFPGHGTPTCLVFGNNERPNLESPICVAAILPGGGDLRTPPEESPLWRTLAEHHDTPGYTDARISVVDRRRIAMAIHPWNFDCTGEATTEIINKGTQIRLKDFTHESIGRDATTQAADIYYVPDHLSRRLRIEQEYLKPLIYGELVRDWQFDRGSHALWPYDLKGRPKLSKRMEHALSPHKDLLERRSQFSKTTLEAGLEWFQYREYHVRGLQPQFVYADLATHNHFTISLNQSTMNQHALLFTPTGTFAIDRACLFISLLNSSAALFWLKQVCFSKRESQEGVTDTYFEFAGGKLQQLPVPQIMADALRGKGNTITDRLAKFARACWERGCQLTTLKLRKLFEQSGEAYHDWNSELPGYVAACSEIQKSFVNVTELQENFHHVIEIRDHLRAEMIASQEEADWLIYAAYNFLPMDSPALGLSKTGADVVTALEREHRPFSIWSQANGDFNKAVALIPEDWSEERKSLWHARLAAIRDNEHVRRIEQALYKRRWDEQWKVGNRWTCGPVAYAAEFVDAFTWWLAEKAESNLEHKAKGGPIGLDGWTAALWKDERIQAAWPVVVDAVAEIDTYKTSVNGNKSKIDASSYAFARFFRELLKDETVPEGIPYAVPWDQLEKKGKIPAKTKSIRGKLNVPRERFHLTSDGRYLWAGKS
jgi:type I restriction-modification system DNA methylase subunit